MSGNNEPKITSRFVRQTREDTIECAYVSSNGQLVIDQHASDEEHLKALATRQSQPMYDCRFYWSDVMPKTWLGRPGKFTVHHAMDKDGNVVEVSVVFEPVAVDA